MSKRKLSGRNDSSPYHQDLETFLTKSIYILSCSTLVIVQKSTRERSISLTLNCFTRLPQVILRYKPGRQWRHDEGVSGKEKTSKDSNW
ncbi:hypothetical protein PROFUN_09860 [Planoprotostelium fungivorum]|uniref:Uncharacterized protein n=1 Tax=Planoprotostelium fungivorum TaxID=1890364 RepID=A0A2P6NFS3_9EUKA|nr:hypothetical protein PROFUN_09860 [Planoprotostelium fungivorum]